MKTAKNILKNRTIALIGGGRMAQALVAGLKKVRPKKIKVSDPLIENRKKIKKLFPAAVISDNNLSVLDADVIILAVKPQVIKEVVAPICKNIKPSVLVISIAAGVNLGWLQKQFPRNPVIRVMPNNPAQIGHGISALCAGGKAQPLHKKMAQEIFGAVGKTFWVAENFMNLITAISGSGPAFFYFFVEALVEAGVTAGLSLKDALDLAVQTGLGSLKMLEHTGLHPQELIGQVTSPGGTTLAGLKILEEGQFKGLIDKTIKAAAQRAKELSRIG